MFRTCFLLALLSCTTILAQEQQHSIAILSQSKSDGIWLRWAPVDAVNWQLGNKFGYTVERITLNANGELANNSRQMLTTEPLKPLTPAEFLSLSDRYDEVATLEELLYGEGSGTDHSTGDLARILEKNNELQNRFGIAMLMCDLSLEAARAAGLFFKDTEAVMGQRYIYRIQIAQGQGSDAIEPSVLVVNHKEEVPLLAIKDLTIEFSDKSATLQWSTLLHKGVYTAYYIERSSDGKNYTRMTDLPYVHMSQDLNSVTAVYVDSLEANLKEYSYRIQGITPFSEVGPYSNVVTGEGKEDLFGQVVLRQGKAGERNSVTLDWEFPAHLEKQIAGFMVSRTNNPDGPYTDVAKKMISRSARKYIDRTPFNNTYYIVKAVNRDGFEITRSFPYLVQIEDNTPPVAPRGITGNITTSGLATLTWNANTDADLLGYRVFMSNSPAEEPVEVTKEILGTLTYVDTVNVHVLNKNVYYYLIAVDRNYNTSDYSSPCVLLKPDIIPPAAPVFTRTELTKDSLMLEWFNSASHDIARTELIRIEKQNDLTRVIRVWTPLSPVEKWVEKSLLPGGSYSYKIVVYDSAGNTSETVSRQIFYEPGFRNAITNLNASVNRDARRIVLEWKNPQPSTKCIVYRRVNESPLTIYITLEGNVESFTDELININNRYSYKVQPVYSNGVKAIISEEIGIIY